MAKKSPSGVFNYYTNSEDFRREMQWLYRGRVITIVPCFLVYIIIALLGGFLPNLTSLLFVIAFELFINAPYGFIVRKFYEAGKTDVLILIMLGFDVIAATIALHAVGLQDGLFFGALYLVTITFAGILSTRKIAYIIATWASLCYAGLALAEYTGVLKHIETIGIKLSGWEIVAWVSSHIVFFYITAYLSSFYSGPLKVREEELYQISKSLEKRLKKNHLEAIRALLKALKVKDPYTEFHSSNSSWYSTLIAEVMGIPDYIIDDIKDACVLHDIGKIGISDEILNKPSGLSPDEWEKIKHHPEYGAEIITSLSGTEDVAMMILQEHERFNGSGYPRGLRGNEICIGAQIISVADAFDVMVSGRPYKTPLHPEDAIKELKANSGSQFSPEVVECFCSIYRQKESEIVAFIEKHKVKI